MASMYIYERGRASGAAVEDGRAAEGTMGSGENGAIVDKDPGDNGATGEGRTDPRAIANRTHDRPQPQKSPSPSVNTGSGDNGATQNRTPDRPQSQKSPSASVGAGVGMTRGGGLYGRPPWPTIRLPRPSVGRMRLPMAAQGVLFAFLLVYLGMQAWTYGLADPGRTFQSAYCLEAPASDAPIIAYMQREHISYAWASNWLAYGIVFKTNGSIVAADPLPFLPRSPNIDRVPANTEAVRHADPPALLVFGHHDDAHPFVLQ